MASDLLKIMKIIKNVYKILVAAVRPPFKFVEVRLYFALLELVVEPNLRAVNHEMKKITQGFCGELHKIYDARRWDHDEIFRNYGQLQTCVRLVRFQIYVTVSDSEMVIAFVC